VLWRTLADLHWSDSTVAAQVPPHRLVWKLLYSAGFETPALNVQIVKQDMISPNGIDMRRFVGR
jgi:hypothetical protein